MTCREAVAILTAELGDTPFVVFTTGMISREAAAADRAGRFYMVGSMGLACPIALGVALAQPGRAVVAVDGDGSALMALGTLAMVGYHAPERFLHVVLDNEAYESTGGQPSISARTPLEAIARAAGYPHARRVDSPESLADALREFRDALGPAFLLVKVSSERGPAPPRVKLSPIELRDRSRGFLARRGGGCGGEE